MSSRITRELVMQIKQLGLTIIELMITIAVLGIVLTVGVPGFQRIMQSNQLAANTNSFLSSLTYARSEAVRRNQNVVICRSSVPDNCGQGDGYEDGWMIFEDINRNDSFDAGTDLALWFSSSINKSLTLRGNASVDDEIAFRPSGRPQFAGNFVLCKDNDVDHSRKLVISRAGHIRLAEPSEITSCN